MGSRENAFIAKMGSCENALMLRKELRENALQCSQFHFLPIPSLKQLIGFSMLYY